MNRNSSSIGYIPPTPFRDDSDIFVLEDHPRESPEEFLPSPAAPLTPRGAPLAGEVLAEETGIIASAKAELQRRRTEVSRRFRGVLQLLSKNNPVRDNPPARSADEQPPLSGPSVPAAGADVRGYGSPDPAVPGTPAESAAGSTSGAGVDRLAALKARLAARLQSVQEGTGDAKSITLPEESRS